MSAVEDAESMGRAVDEERRRAITLAMIEGAALRAVKERRLLKEARAQPCVVCGWRVAADAAYAGA